jgi:signal transduction histidine kinase
LLVLAVISGLLSLLWRYLRKVKRLNSELAASNNVKDTLFSVIGHDLKGPAASALQLFELLETGDISEGEMKALIGDLRKQTNASLDLLQSLFEWGKAQLQGIKVNPSDFSIADIIERCIQLLSQQAADKQITLNADVPAGLQIRADPNHVEFVIRNLLANAIKFSYPAMQIYIQAQSLPDTAEVQVAITDHGVGINAEQQALFKVSNLKVSFGTAKEKGSGLGLLLSKDFISANGGRIWLNSQEGKGTTFFVALPAA